MVTPGKVYPKAELLKKGMFFSNTLRMLKDPVEFLGKLTRSYGPVVSANLFGKKYFVLQHPEYIKHVLLDNHKAYNKPCSAKILRLFLGEGLLTSNGELWHRKRRLMQPAFHRQRLARILDIINEETGALIEKLNAIPPNTRINISQVMLQLNISIISRSMFGSAVKEEMDTMMKVLEELTAYGSAWMKSIIKMPVRWPTPANVKFNKNCKIFDSIIYAIIERRRRYRADSSRPSHDDLLDMLLDYVDEETMNEMTVKQLRDEITTIFIAGHETTAQTLSWIFYELGKEKWISKKIANEAANVFKGESPGVEDLAKLIYTKQVMHEGMRFYPSLRAIVRKPNHSDVINEIKIPASSIVLINIYGMHHHPGYWKNPEKFDPEHFDAISEQQREQFVYFPFGGGQRLCIGNNFAIMVMEVVLSRLAGSFEFDVPGGYTPEIEPNITLRAKDGIQMIIRKLS